MKPDKLNELIAEENKALEQQAANEAKNLIRGITSRRQQILNLQGEINDLQVKLRALQIQTVDPVSILGD